MRYPQMSDSDYPEPAGLRGWSPGSASWLWGLSNNEYRAVADVWPLNPNGELLAIMMIESAAGVQNIEEILKVPGVDALFMGPADLAFSMGVPNGAPEVEEALQKILKACLAANVVCGMSINASQMADRIKEGWRMLNLGGANGSLNAGMLLLLVLPKKPVAGTNPDPDLPDFANAATTRPRLRCPPRVRAIYCDNRSALVRRQRQPGASA